MTTPVASTGRPVETGSAGSGSPAHRLQGTKTVKQAQREANPMKKKVALRK